MIQRHLHPGWAAPPPTLAWPLGLIGGLTQPWLVCSGLRDHRRIRSCIWSKLWWFSFFSFFSLPSPRLCVQRVCFAESRQRSGCLFCHLHNLRARTGGSKTQWGFCEAFKEHDAAPTSTLSLYISVLHIQRVCAQTKWWDELQIKASAHQQPHGATHCVTWNAPTHSVVLLPLSSISININSADNIYSW